MSNGAAIETVIDFVRPSPAGKCQRRRKVVAAGAFKPAKDRLWVHDRDGAERYLVDTGADVSLEV